MAASVAKELIDNALDNCEEIGTLPEITITLGEDSLTVIDNGLMCCRLVDFLKIQV